MSPDDVTDFKSFLAFVDWLARDRADAIQQEEGSSRSKDWGTWANGWQNASVEGFLEACMRWAVDWAEKTGTEPEASWREFARILNAGKIYE